MFKFLKPTNDLLLTAEKAREIAIAIIPEKKFEIHLNEVLGMISTVSRRGEFEKTLVSPEYTTPKMFDALKKLGYRINGRTVSW